MAKPKIDILNDEVKKLIVVLKENGIKIKEHDIYTSLGINGHIIITLKGDFQ